MDLTPRHNIVGYESLISEYCIAKNKAVLYFEVNISVARRQELCDYYEGKIEKVLLEAIKRDDDNFLIFLGDADAIMFAELNFPYQSQIDEQDYWIHCKVWNREGVMVWENNDINLRSMNVPPDQLPTA